MRTLFFILYFLRALCAYSYNPFPEAADKNSVFAGVLAPELSFNKGFGFEMPVVFADYVSPVLLPLSVGFFLKMPEPNLKSFGLRAAYHINIESPKIDLYFMYVFDFGFIRNGLLVQYNDTPVAINYYDFRAGMRYLIGRGICLSVETAFKFQGILFGASIKLN